MVILRGFVAESRGNGEETEVVRKWDGCKLEMKIFRDHDGVILVSYLIADETPVDVQQFRLDQNPNRMWKQLGSTVGF